MLAATEGSMVLTNPFFWAFLATFAIVGGDAIQGSPVVGRSTSFGLAVVLTATFGRVVLALPFVVQPRFGAGPVLWVAGAVVVALSLAIMAPLLRIRPLTQPDAAETLRTSGVYELVRHPGYLANTLWGLGWAIVFGSTIGVLLTPVWAAVFWLHALIEEESLQRAYGGAYREYMARVPCRLIPGIPL
jgi:protein-S-isoprenylcysteine O-methyltransferase Ste14